MKTLKISEKSYRQEKLTYFLAGMLAATIVVSILIVSYVN